MRRLLASLIMLGLMLWIAYLWALDEADDLIGGFRG